MEYSFEKGNFVLGVLRFTSKRHVWASPQELWFIWKGEAAQLALLATDKFVACFYCLLFY